MGIIYIEKEIISHHQGILTIQILMALPCHSFLSIIALNKSSRQQCKARWQLYLNAACCFEQILKAVHYKTTAVWPLASDLTNHPSKTSKTYCALVIKL